jgi:transposase
MPPRTPAHVREHAVAALETGVSRHDVATTLGVSIRTVDRWRWKARHDQPLADRPRSGRPPAVGPADRPVLLAWVSAHPDATLAEIAAWWTTQSGRTLGWSTISRLLRRAGLTRKKRP